MSTLIKYIVLAVSLLTMAACGSSKKKVKFENANQGVSFSNIDFWKPFTISNAEFGTQTSFQIKGNERFIETNALPNHSVGDFPNPGNPNTISPQERTYNIPLEPKMSGESKWVREPGVALNGVKFEPETAERFICESGEVYRIEAVQDLVDLGLDFNHAHVQPTGAYHYHGVPVGLINALETEQDVVLVGFAKDGFPIYYSQSGKYKPSFKIGDENRTGDACSCKNPHQSMDKILKDTKPDGTFVSDWEYVEGLAQLDECNGIEIDGKYAYFVTDEYPYVPRCLKGVFTEERHNGPPPGSRGDEHSHGGGPPHRHN